MAQFKAQVSRPLSINPDRFAWAERFDGWRPGWHTFARGTRAQCEAATRLAHLQGAGDLRVVPIDKPNDED